MFHQDLLSWFGNRRSFEEEGNTTSYTYDALDRLISSETTFAGNGVHEITAYNYDRRGNMTEMFVDGAISKRFKFDSTNKMIWGYDRDKGEADYKYNGIGKRVAVKTPEEDIEYILDITKFYNDMLGREVNGQKESYVYDSGIISMDRDGEDYFYLLDELGSTMRLTGTDGDTVSAYAYDEFGRTFDPFTGKNKKAKEHPYNKEGNILQPLAFTGYQTDDITGNYYAQARYYNAGSGRFISRDKDAFMFIEDPESLNLYEYCQNSPIEFFDPTGNDPVDRDIGNDAHTKLETYAELLNVEGIIPGVVRTNHRIDGGAFHTNGEYGKADIVIFHDGIAEVYEIKPASYLKTTEIETDPRYYKNGELPAEGANKTRHQLGLDQMQGHVDAYNNNGKSEFGATQAVPGGYKPYFNVTLPASDGGKYRYFTRADSPGMIYYEYKGPEDELRRRRRDIPASRDNDKDNSQGKGGNNSNITEFKPEQKKSPDIAAIVIDVFIVVVLIAIVVLAIIGIISAAAGAAMASFAALCLFVVKWFNGLFNSNACDGPA
ncbi:RHS repeat domain-containing protein [Butyrivibrio sp. INlla16]|uniref:RHS repeat domain-containing protein n=1 Tax=Butyrivibrio sp. INlla16 TaxID=1520807 RepID=UPI00088BBD24|nr:RHS repeat-associated core domain-containing protein [Butyrivibrio sp. INlla16]SDB19778.1 RHS repeat-associated core domain-containing protein [Butyrivibrio sp. INlla16]